jgi:hypothetical protein
MARSTRRTEAPLSARRRPVKGAVGLQYRFIICIARDEKPGASPANSITRMPVRGGAPVMTATRSAIRTYDGQVPYVEAIESV